MENGVAYSDHTLLDYLAIAVKRWRWVLAAVVISTGLIGYFSYSQPDTFEAEAVVLLADTAARRTLDPSSQNTGFLRREMSNEISLARSDAVESLVTDSLGRLPEVRIASEAEADVLVFRAATGDPDQAARYANTWAEMYVQVKQDEAVMTIAAAAASLRSGLEDLRLQRQQLREPLEALDSRIGRAVDSETAARLQADYVRLADDLRYELDLLTAQAEAQVVSLTELGLQGELSAVGEARIIQRAAPPDTRSNMALSRALAIGVILGLIVGVVLAFFAELRDTTIKSSADIQAVTDLPVLASIPKASKKQRVGLGMVTHQDPEGAFADGYHKVRSSLEFMSLDGDLKSVLVTSPSPSEGKSTTSANLALALRSVGKKTVLVDVDFRRATIHKIFGVEQFPGISDSILNDAEITTVSYSIEGEAAENLVVFPTGTIPPSPTAFIGTSRFLNTVEWLKAQADMVIFDAPPLLAVSDAHSLSRHVDAVILTAMAGQTKKADLAEVISMLSQVGANLAGVVLVGVDEAERYYANRYYRDDHAPDEASKPGKGSEGLWGDSNTIELTDQEPAKEPVKS